MKEAQRAEKDFLNASLEEPQEDKEETPPENPIKTPTKNTSTKKSVSPPRTSPDPSVHLRSRSTSSLSKQGTPMKKQKISEKSPTKSDSPLKSTHSPDQSLSSRSPTHSRSASPDYFNMMKANLPEETPEWALKLGEFLLKTQQENFNQLAKSVHESLVGSISEITDLVSENKSDLCPFKFPITTEDEFNKFLEELNEENFYQKMVK